MRFSFPVALATGCFIIGLALGATCVLRRTQVGVNPRLSPVSLSAGSSEKPQGNPRTLQPVHQGPREARGLRRQGPRWGVGGGGPRTGPRAGMGVGPGGKHSRKRRAGGEAQRDGRARV